MIFYYYINNNNKMEQLYLEQLTPQERKAHDIAKSHLGTSFDVLRSNGYKAWIKKQDKDSLEKTALLSSISPSFITPSSNITPSSTITPSSITPSSTITPSSSSGPSTVKK